jgi:uncharacterized protein (TIGR00369 family)
VGVSVSVTKEQAQQWLGELFAPWVQALGLRVEAIGAGEATLLLPFDASLAREGGTLCGQALMAAADTSMVLAIASSLGGFRPMTTVSLNSSFMRPVSGGGARLVARVLKPGRTLMFGEIEILGAADGKLVAHATTTYALL